MMDSSYVKEMERLASEGRIVDIEGQQFSSLPMKPIFYEPRPAPLTVRTLTGLAGYLGANVDRLDLDSLIVQVESHTLVMVLSALSGMDRKRDTLIAAKYDGATFHFGEWMDSESFIIAVNALFVPTDTSAKLLDFVSRLKIENEANLTDDGVSQTATIKTGIRGGLTEATKAPSRIALTPYRTFSEVAQPESEFVFRMRRDGDEVALALFEADGGSWKSTAMDSIEAWLAGAIPAGIATIA